MATLASTNITTAIAVDNSQPLAWGTAGLICEVVEFPGGSAGDTVVITPRWITDIRLVSVNSSASDNLNHTVANTNVTLTVLASAATNVTFQVQVIGRR